MIDILDKFSKFGKKSDDSPHVAAGGGSEGSRKPVESYLFTTDKQRIVDLVQEMGMKVADALKLSVDALVAEDLDLAGQVVKGDDDIDAMEEAIDLECLRSIAMRQPVRDDLRFIFTVLKTVIDLERIGDQAVNVAKWTVELKKYPRMEITEMIPEMRDVAEAMLRDAMNAFKNSDGSACGDIYNRDDILDKNYSAIFNSFIEKMASGAGDVNIVRVLTAQMWIARHLERVGDHITNIAERVYFMDRGENLSHHRDKILGLFPV